MRQLSLLLFISFISLVSFAQKQVNDPNAESRSVSGFHKIEVSSGIQLFLSQSNSEAVAVSAVNAEYRSRIKTEVINGVLKIYYDRNFLKDMSDRPNKKLKAYVSVVNLDGLSANSGALVKGQDLIRSSSLDMKATSGAQIEIKVQASRLTVDQNSGSIVNVSGSSGSVKADGSSGSIFNGFDLAADNAEADCSSGAIIRITVNKELKAEASSGGLVQYKGSGVIRDIHTSSGGNISKKG